VARQLPGKKAKKGIGQEPEAWGKDCLADGRMHWLAHLLLPVFWLFSMFFQRSKASIPTVD
jgi:hypothetical protein